MKSFKLLFMFSLLAGLLILDACSDDEPEPDVIPQYKLELTTAGQGEVSNSSEQETYAEGSEVTLTANPDEGWNFGGWSGDITSTSNPLTITIDGDKALLATFTQIPTYSLTLSTEGNGTVETNPATNSYMEGAEVTLTATADVGWEFSGWSGDITSTDNPLMISVDGEKTLKATFTEKMIYLASNGVTIKASSNAVVGESYELNGVNYKVVDEAMLYSMVSNDEDVTKIVTTNVTNMRYLFDGKNEFNQNISSWDVSNVTIMEYMFRYATTFDQDISNWNVSSVTTMQGMFFQAGSFNQPIGSWDVSSVTNMGEMLRYCTYFNQPLGDWDVSAVVNMGGLFSDTQFNQDISGWNVSNVTSLSGIFADSPFNQDIGGWDVSKVTNMFGVFLRSDFNKDISNWDVSSVTNMSAMFQVSPFNQDISNWNVGNVTSMNGMFWQNYSFNQDISGWNVSKVTNMRGMFRQAYAFNQDLSGWSVDKVTDCSDFAYFATAWSQSKPNFTSCTQ